MGSIIGTDGRDELEGTVQDDVIEGLGGDDSLFGDAGHDLIEGGDGNDTLDGDLGNDTLEGGDGDDFIADYYGNNVLRGGAGNDRLDGGGSDVDGVVVLDGGEGDDYLRSWAPDTTYIGGEGRDRFYVETRGPGYVVADFEVGAGGDYLDISTVIARLQNYDGSNPFATGHLRLIQDGEDAVLEVDLWLSGTFIETIRLEGVELTDLVAQNFRPPFPTDGSPPIGREIFGTENSDQIEGDIGADTIEGLGGDDNINGGTGDDIVRGGDGDDFVDGGLGDDTVEGGDGDDDVRDYYGNNVLRGGDGDDWIDGGGSDVDGFATLEGGDGDDYLRSNAPNTVYVGGEGRDGFYVETRGPGFVVTDFEVGSEGDYLDIDVLLARSTGYDGTNPFASGHLRLVQVGDDAVLEWDRDLSGSFIEVIRLAGIDAASLTAANFDPRFSPDGSVGGETIEGTSASEEIEGSAGSDIIFGYGGDDQIYGATGDDRIDGGEGDDFIDGGLGNDTLEGGDGDDDVRDYYGNNVLRGGAGDDWIDGGGSDVDGSATLEGGDGNDYLRSNAPETLYVGGEGRDGFYVETRGPGFLVADFETGVGGDYLDISTAVRRLQDYDGTNPFGTGHVQLRQDGDDTIFEWRRTLTEDFIELIRLSDVDASEVVSANLSPGFGTPNDDAIDGTNKSEAIFALDGDDSVIAGAGNDSIDGGDGADFIIGDGDLQEPAARRAVKASGGKDSLDGGSGDDTLRGGAGADKIDGGAGRDVADYRDSTGVAIALDGTLATTGDAKGDKLVAVEDLYGSLTGQNVLRGDASANDIRGGAAADVLSGAAGNDSLTGSDGDDTLSGGDGADRLAGGGDRDTASYADAAAAVRVSLKDASLNTGEAEGDVFQAVEALEGSQHGDWLAGSRGANRLVGGAGNDTIEGDDGNDVIVGGAGKDMLYGGGGKDTFEFLSIGDSGNSVGKSDLVADFEAGSSKSAVDRLDLSDIDANETKGGDQAFIFVGNAALEKGKPGQVSIKSVDGATIILINTDNDAKAEMQITLTGKIVLDASDFIL